jgi:hypothetical protein
MPEAPVHEDDRPVLGQNDVRRPWKVLPVKTKSVAHAVKKGTHPKLRSRVRASDS